jgi:hypothetical protein
VIDEVAATVLSKSGIIYPVCAENGNRGDPGAERGDKWRMEGMECSVDFHLCWKT